MILTVVVHVQAVFELFLVAEHAHSKNGAKKFGAIENRFLWPAKNLESSVYERLERLIVEGLERQM